MTYPIFQWSEQVGELTVTEDGLYYELNADIPDDGQLVRLYLVGPEQTALLGTPLPEDGRLICRRRLSRRQTPGELLGALVCRGEWSDWQRHGDGWRRMNSEQIELAQPYRQDEPIEGAEQFPDLRTQEIEGEQCIVRSLSPAAYIRQTTGQE